MTTLYIKNATAYATGQRLSREARPQAQLNRSNVGVRLDAPRLRGNRHVAEFRHALDDTEGLLKRLPQLLVNERGQRPLQARAAGSLRGRVLQVLGAKLAKNNSSE